MTHCPSCTMPVEASSRFCGVCGTRLDSEEAAAAKPPTNPGSPRAVQAASVGQQQPAASASASMPKTLVAAEPPAIAKSIDLFNSNDPYLGTTLNKRFLVESKLGEGGFGAVYKGVQTGTNRIVALKLLHPEMTRDKNVVERFRLEGQVLCSLRDAHTITTYDFDQTEDGTLFIAMELLEGQSLHDVFGKEAPIGWMRMVKILSEMCTSLAEAHSMGIVHRDLKPENVHLEKRPGNDEFVKILDFGIAKMLRGDGIGGTGGPQLTATGQTLGTLEYMSPEQLMGKELDGRSDIYGLGVLAYELMTGQLPFPDALGPAMLISAQLKKVPPSPSTVHATGGIPRDVDAMILKMLEKDRNNRFADVSVLRTECLRILAEASPATASAAQAPGAVPHVSHAGQVAPSSPASLSPPDPQLARPPGHGPSTKAIIAATSPRPRWIWGLLAAVVLGGGVAAFLLAQ